MAIDESRAQILERTRAQHVSLSRWVNEPLPSCEDLLTAHDVARLMRRPHWVFSTLALFGCFPKKQRYHGRGIGWRRRDVLRWIASDRCDGFSAPGEREVSQLPVQQELELRHQRCRFRGVARPRCSSSRRKRLVRSQVPRMILPCPADSKSVFPSRRRSTSRCTSRAP